MKPNNMNITTTILSLFNNSSNKPKKEGYYGSHRNRVPQRNLNMSRKELFLSGWNIKKLTIDVFENYKEHIGGPLKYTYFIGHVPTWMKKWNKLPILDDYEDLRGNFVDTFVHINQVFISEHIERLRENVNNAATSDISSRYGASSFDDITNNDVDLYYRGTPYSQYWNDAPEGESNLFGHITGENASYYNDVYNKRNTEQGQKMLDELKNEAASTVPNRDEFYAEDYRQLDFWDNNYDSRRHISNDQYRYHNQIPIYQKSMQIRHYDRSTEGYRQRGSVINDRNRKYDLTPIIEGFVAYPVEGYGDIS